MPDLEDEEGDAAAASSSSVPKAGGKIEEVE